MTPRRDARAANRERVEEPAKGQIPNGWEFAPHARGAAGRQMTAGGLAVGSLRARGRAPTAPPSRPGDRKAKTGGAGSSAVAARPLALKVNVGARAIPHMITHLLAMLEPQAVSL